MGNAEGNGKHLLRDKFVGKYPPGLFSGGGSTKIEKNWLGQTRRKLISMKAKEIVSL